MGFLQLQQIETRLDETLVPFVDVSDLENHPPDEMRKNQLSRAVAAFAIAKLWEWDPESAASCITDGPKDNGLDAIAVDPTTPRIMLVQSKWHTGNGTMQKADMILFRDGVEDLLNSRREKFSPEIQARWKEIAAVLSEPSLKISLVCVHTGSGSLSDEVSGSLTPLLNDLNEFDQVAGFQYLSQSELHGFLSTVAAPIDIDVELSDWGFLEGPVRAFYGHVSSGEVARWHSVHGDSLFNSNLRSTLPNSAVNDGIELTLRESPQLFWYFNNGVTVLCSKIEKAPVGSADRRVGSFRFSGIQIVNGAQTVGSISNAIGAVESNGPDGPGEGDALDESAKARVLVRFIELEGTPDSFASEVTRWTNTQNRVGGRDFLALDPEQARIANEFSIDGLTYVFRSGEDDPEPADGCGVQEATVALACARPDIRLAVQAKREVSRLWSDIERAPYKVLFNPSTTSTDVWVSVKILRAVEERLAEERKDLAGRQQSFMVHLNRVVLWIVNRHLRSRYSVESEDWTTLSDEIESLVALLVPHLAWIADSEYPGYPANLAKNASECERLAAMTIEFIEAEYESVS